MPLATLPFGRFFLLLSWPDWLAPGDLRSDLLVVVGSGGLTDNVVDFWRRTETVVEVCCYPEHN